MIFSGKNFSFELGKQTYIMGILNVTADSFFDGGKYNTPDKAVKRATQMLSEGAHIIDIGAASTRPGHKEIAAEEELSVIKRYLPLVYDKSKAVISVDTVHPSVAEYALENGAAIINDVSGVFNPRMAELVKRYDCGWIITHTGGGNSDTVSDYENGVTDDVIQFFNDILLKCENFGISSQNIMLDIGIGFGKNHSQNIEVLKNIGIIKRKHVALLTALSSKRVVKVATDCDGDDLLFGTISGNVLAVSGGTDFVRVHSVRENALALKMADYVVRNNNG